ncbi:hypothetical protein B0H11DRAFT_1914589 [Mycena galericulata]|nr:hypothetical protein B0H11DRAFT_1914589 [Mycena galericulata]
MYNHLAQEGQIFSSEVRQLPGRWAAIGISFGIGVVIGFSQSPTIYHHLLPMWASGTSELLKALDEDSLDRITDAKSRMSFAGSTHLIKRQYASIFSGFRIDVHPLFWPMWFDSFRTPGSTNHGFFNIFEFRNATTFEIELVLIST